jgi:hypothetical protein
LGDDRIIACLREQHGLPVSETRFLPSIGDRLPTQDEREI